MSYKNPAIIPSSGRISAHQSPMGSRSQYWYNSPQIVPNHSFNFWKDIQINVQTRNKWEDSSTFQGENNCDSSVMSVKTLLKRQARSPQAQRSTMFQQNTQKGPIPKQHMARFIYSQVDLGDTDSSRSNSVHSNLSKSRLNSQSRIVVDEKMSHVQNNINKEGIADINLKRKQDSKLKWFTSQIDILPGPQTEVIKHVGRQYKQEKGQENKLAEEKNRLKNRVLLGSYYQDQKYVDKVKPNEKFKQYKKEVKSEWNRNPNNEFTKRMRDNLIYKSTKLY